MLAWTHRRLPDSVMIEGKFEVQSEPMAWGGFSDVYKGEYGGHSVAVKRLRAFPPHDIKTRKVRSATIFPLRGN